MIEPSKECVTCGFVKNLDEYHLHRGKRDGRTSSCKECAKARTAEWIRNNRGRHNAGQRRRYHADIEKARATARATMARRRVRVAAHRVDLFAGDPCVYCGVPSTTDDHIRPVAKGGPDHASNMARTCLRCNQEKSDSELLTFMLDRLTSA